MASFDAESQASSAAAKVQPEDDTHSNIDAKHDAAALLDWEGPSDPANPRNWSLAKRAFHTGLPALYALLV